VTTNSPLSLLDSFGTGLLLFIVLLTFSFIIDSNIAIPEFILTMAIFQQQQQQRASFFYLVVCFVVAIVAASSSSLRGQDDTLRERVTNPTIRDDIRGKTLKELGVAASTTTTTAKTTEQQGRRKTQDQLTFNYLSVRKINAYFVQDPSDTQSEDDIST
jgi:hypothetical protein